jgi:hypothetical protein
VATQLKTLMAVGIATKEGQAREDHAGQRRLTRHEHVVAPDQEADDRDRRSRQRDEAVAEDGLAREDR